MTPRLIETPVDPIKEPQLFRTKSAECVGSPSPLGGGGGDRPAPCYNVIDCEQRSEEWFKARSGVITASRVGKFVVNTGVVAERARADLCCETAGEAVEPMPEFDNWIVARGRALEPLALADYEKNLEQITKSVGFCLHVSGAFGCSPDALVVDERGTALGGLEIKCPLAKAQIKYLAKGEFPFDDYGPQVHASMATTGLPWWDFYSFHPSLPPFYRRIMRDDYTEAMLVGLLDLGVDVATLNQLLYDMCKDTLKLP